MRAVLQVVDRALGQLCVLLLAGLLAVVCWQVISRYVLASPSTVSEELARLALMALGVLGSTYTAGRGQHLAIDLWGDRLSPLGLTLTRVAIWTSQGAVALALLLGGVELVRTTWVLGQKTAVLGAPIALLYCVVPLCGSILLLYLFRDVVLDET